MEAINYLKQIQPVPLLYAGILLQNLLSLNTMHCGLLVLYWERQVWGRQKGRGLSRLHRVLRLQSLQLSCPGQFCHIQHRDLQLCGIY